MSEVVLRIAAAGGRELVFDDADAIAVQSPVDVEIVSCAEHGCGGCGWTHRRAGRARLILDFADGKMPQWREATESA